MASPITPSTGLGSGLNITELVNVLVTADTAAKKAQITRQTSNNSAMLSGIGSLRSALTTFTSAMSKLNSSTSPSFNAFSASSGNEALVKATATNKAVAGTYSIEVTQLATSSKVATQAFADGADHPIAEGEMVISVGTGTSYTVKVGPGSTLQTVRDQINKELSASGMSANIVTGKDGSRLVLSSSKTGAGNDISVTGDITELNLDGTRSMAQDGAGYIDALARDAKLTIDGLEVESASNKVSTAISGLTLELTGAAVGTKTTVTVAANKDGLKTSIQSFVDAYNTLQKTITALTTSTRDEDDNLQLGPLSNDPTTRSLLADMRGVLAEIGSGDRLTTLGQLGINTQKDGTLEFNSTKFSAAMDDKKLGPEVQELFTGTDGIFARMNKAIDPYNSAEGSLATRKASLDRVGKNLSDQQAALDRRTDSLTESLTKRYVALDTALGKMKAQADQITSIFEAINAQAKNS